MSGEADVLVVGGGIVGVATAIELRRRGVEVTLVDRREPGRETSFGNAGLIQREGVHPYLFPSAPRDVLANALKRRTEANYHVSALAHVAPFLWRYWRFSSTPERVRRTVEANIPLFENCVSAHRTLAEEAGAADLIHATGWLRLFRSADAARGAEAELAELRDLGLTVRNLDGDALAELEPNLDASRLAAAVHYEDPWSCRDPGALVTAHARLLEAMGGRIERFEVQSLSRTAQGWSASDGTRTVSAGQAVIAAGPWSRSLCEKLGLSLPMGIKRGYHRHHAARGNAVLGRTVVDHENGFVMAPMERGIRVTSGAEFARHDAPPTPVQLERVMPLAKELFPLGESLDDTPWLGARPVFPDMLPVMGAAPGLPGLWLNFGHGHQGFTLGPVAGRLVAQMMTGDTPDFDPAPYAATRFGW